MSVFPYFAHLHYSFRAGIKFEETVWDHLSYQTEWNAHVKDFRSRTFRSDPRPQIGLILKRNSDENPYVPPIPNSSSTCTHKVHNWIWAHNLYQGRLLSIIERRAGTVHWRWDSHKIIFCIRISEPQRMYWSEFRSQIPYQQCSRVTISI